jgi:pyroglutamyl-peptidase
VPLLLLTAFGPFGDVLANPSEEAVRAVGTRGLGGVRLFTEILPVDFARCVPRISSLVRELHPDIVLSTGVADRDLLTLERVAINLIDARIPDNAGVRPVDVPVVPGGPVAHLTTLPVKAMAEAIRGTGVACGLSLSAGSYACNAVMYAALHDAPAGTRAGFAHLPPVDRLALDDAVTALEVALSTALTTSADAALPEGAPS